jgi:DNA-binding transcriptional MerR regulator
VSTPTARHDTAMKRAMALPTPPEPDTEEPATFGSEGLVLIGKLAEMSSVAPSAIRFYEKEGLLEPKKLGRLRTYSATDAQTLRLIVKLRKTGLPVNKVREVLLLSKPSDNNGHSQTLVQIIEKQIEDLLRMNEVVGEQINNAMALLRELDATRANLAT